MLSTNSLKAFIEAINIVAVTGNKVTTSNDDWKDKFNEEKQQQLLESLFVLVDTHQKSTSATNLVRRFVVLLEKCYFPLLDLTDRGIRSNHHAATPLESSSTKDLLWSKVLSLLGSSVHEKYKSLFQSENHENGALGRCEMLANLRISGLALPPDQVISLHLVARKKHLMQHTEMCRKEDNQDLTQQVQSFHDCSCMVITALKSDSKLLVRVCPATEWGRTLKQMGEAYLNVLSRELETILVSVRQSSRTLNDSASPTRMNLTTSRARFDSSYSGFGNDANDTSLVYGDDGVHQSSSSLDKNSVELLLRLMTDCSQVEDILRDCIYSVDPRILFRENSDPHSKERSSSDYQWRWRFMFVPFMADMIPIMNLAICFDCLAATEEEWEFLRSNSGSPPFVSSNDSASSIRLLKSVALLCDSLTTFGIRLTTDSDSCLAPVHTSYLLCAKQQCTEAANHALKLARHSSCRIDVVYVILNSTFRLQDCVHKLASRDVEFQSMEEDMSGVATVLLDQILSYHDTVLATSLLHDAESNDWTNSKPFFENERCSFSVQAWYNHLSALKHDLWQIAAAAAEQSICHRRLQRLFLDVLEHSLQILVARYSCVVPSFARLSQMQSDMVAILLGTSEFLLGASTDMDSFLGLDDGYEIAAKIHAHCSALLDVLFVVTSPFKKLYKLFKKVFPSNDDTLTSFYERRYANLRWLSYVRPSILKSVDRSPLGPGSLITMHLKLFIEQPVFNYGLLLKVLVATDTILAKLILANPDIAVCYDPQVAMSTNPTISIVPSGEECLRSVLYVLAHMSSAPHCFAEVYLHVFGRDLEAFDGRGQAKIPLWMQVLTESMQVLLVSLRECYFVHLLTFADLKDNPKELNSLLITSLSLQTSSDASWCRVISDALEEMLSTVCLKLGTIPYPVCILLARLTQLDATIFRSFKLVVAALYKYFLDLSVHETKSVCVGADTFAQINKSIVYLLNPSAVADSIPPEFRSCLSRLDSYSIRVGKLVDNYVASCNVTRGSGISPTVNGNVDVISGDLAYLVSNEKGMASLQVIHWFVRSHMNWLENRLCISEEPGMRLPESENQFKSSSESHLSHVSRNAYNPFANLDTIGATGFSFQQISLAKVINWDKLLQDNVHTSKLVFSILLGHRWEFQQDARLDENQKKYVTILRQKYCLDL